LTNAQTAGFYWGESDHAAPLGSTVGGRTTSIEFKRTGSAGTYAIEVTARNLASPAGAFVQFIYDKRTYRLMMQSVPGASIAGPVALDGAERSATLDVTLEQDEELSMFDILVTDSTAIVTLTLPDGRTLREGLLPDRTFEWGQTTNASDGIMLLPDKGTHNVVSFERAAKGRYRIHAEAQAPSAPAQLTVAFIPLGRMLSPDVGKLAQSLPREVHVQAWLGLDNSREYFVGDSIELLVGFSGDPVADTVNLEVRTEYQEALPRTGAEMRYLPPVVELAPVEFRRNADGRYSGIVKPTRAGVLRVGVRATGTTVSGRSFRDESFPEQVLVSRVIARFRSLTEHAVDVDGSGTLDRLDITARLNVLLAGEYYMRVFVEGAGNEGMYADITRALATGDQTLAVSIPAAGILRNLQDGPWTIKWVRMYRSTGDGYGDSVADLELNGFKLQTAAYKIDQWDRGPSRLPVR
jgi:hypothetical protein